MQNTDHPKHHMYVLVVGTQKGGEGKSTSAIHLAFDASERLGMRVLLVDTDEGDLASVFPEAPEDKKFLMASHLYTGKGGKRKPRQVAPNIWLIAADVEVLDVDDMPLSVVRKPAEVLSQFSDDFDLVIIDTPPNLQRRMIGALAAADGVVAPFSINTFSLHRIPKFINTVEIVQQNFNPRLRHLGLLPNKLNSKSVDEMTALPELQKAYGDFYIDTPIISRACIPTSLAQGKPVWRNASSGNQRASAKELRAACKAVLDRLMA